MATTVDKTKTLVLTGGAISTESGVTPAELAAEVDALESAVTLRNQYSTRVYADRATAVADITNLTPSQTTRIITVEGQALCVRAPFQNGDDPLSATSPYWGVVLRQDVSAEATARAQAITALQNNLSEEAMARANADTALTTEFRDGRVWTASGSMLTPSGIAVPTGVVTVVTRSTTTNRYRMWRRATDPTDGVETDILVKDASGQWWARVQDYDAASLAVEVRDGRVFTIAGGTNPSGASIPVDYSVDLVICRNNGNGRVTMWRAVGAPSDGIETDTTKKDANGNWWSVLTDDASATGIAWLQDGLSSEASLRQSGDDALLQRIVNETTAREIGDAALQVDIDAEVKDRTALIHDDGADGLSITDESGFVTATIGMRESMLSGMRIVDDGADGLSITDESGFVTATIGMRESMLSGMRIVDDGADGLSITDESGFVTATIGMRESMLSGMRIVDDGADGLSITDESGFVLGAFGDNGAYVLDADDPPTPPSSPPLLYASPKLAAAEGQTINIYAHGLVPDRSIIGTVMIEIIGASGVVATGDYALQIQPDNLGSSCEIVAAPIVWDGLDRSFLPMTVSVAPVPAVSPTEKNILMIGDSITNRQAADLLDQHLTGWGYMPNWIGTMHGSANPARADDASGPLGEAREGWETGDYTFSVTDRTLVVTPGDEATYLSMTKTEQTARNPFLRIAIETDAIADVRNGYVFDVSNYLSRFDLQNPDIVVIGLGTNDIRDRPIADIKSVIADNYDLLIRRIRAALPLATIIIWMPGTSRDATRDVLWRDAYVPAISGIMDAVAAAADDRVVVAPIWAMAPALGGYTHLAGTTDATTGTIVAGLNDTIHPVGGARAATFAALAGYIAAVMAEKL